MAHRLKVCRGHADMTLTVNSTVESPTQAAASLLEIESEAKLTQFNRLMQDLLKGNMNRNTFRPWEITLLLDIESCSLANGNRREVLRRYQKAVQRSYDRGETSLLRLSDYLENLRNKRKAS
jgi:hypothetical protein